MDVEKIIKGLEECAGNGNCTKCQYGKEIQALSCKKLLTDALELVKSSILITAVKPTIDEYGKAYCICGENVGIIPNNKRLPSVFAKYCPKCGRRMKWDD